jgi:phospholipase C
MALDPLPGFTFFRKNDRARTCFVPTARLFKDLSSGELPATAWVLPNAEESDHPLTDSRVGTWYVAGIVNALIKSPYWRTTVLVASWDEYGGSYDHVAPPADGMGIRVPALIISARARPGYVDHTTYDFSPVLKLIETRFELSPLSVRDAEAQDIGGSLDMSQPQLSPLLITSP